jgi:mono/diheme cytochrome c family protein/small nuclear ribonucleoprotein (snRNP)-like protein
LLLVSLAVAVALTSRVGAQAYPPRPAAPADVLERGKALYSLHCALCHGADARGAAGPSLLRSELVLEDQKGELIGEVLRTGRAERGMPAFTELTPANSSDIAAYVHSFPVGSRDPARMRPPTIVVGDAAAGVAVFGRKCGSCHSATGDLKGFGARFTDPRQMQQWWLMPTAGGSSPGGGPALKPVTVTVTLPSGQKVEGRLRRIDDFLVSLYLADGSERTIARNGATPRVELHDPLQPHRDLLPTYADEDIHDVTAYLVTLK